jgi:hypothetical protein
MLSARQTGKASPAHPLIRSLIPRRAGGRWTSRPAIARRPRPLPTTGHNSQNYKGGCS